MGGTRCALVVLVAAMGTWSVGPVAAQDNYEIQVYGSDLVPTGATMVELHCNYAAKSGVDLGPGQYSTLHAEHEAVEITHGFTDFFEIAYYNFTTIQPGVGFNWVGTRIRPRVAIPASWHWPVGLSLSQEIGYQRKEYLARHLDLRNPAHHRSADGPVLRVAQSGVGDRTQGPRCRAASRVRLPTSSSARMYRTR